MIAIEIPGHPIAFARARSRGAQRFTPKPQREYGNLIRLAASQRMTGHELFAGPLRLVVRAVYVAPASWSQKKKDAIKWKTSKPDFDNLAKIAADAMNGIVYVDDVQIVEANIQKVYGHREMMVIEVSEVTHG